MFIPIRIPIQPPSHAQHPATVKVMAHRYRIPTLIPYAIRPDDIAETIHALTEAVIISTIYRLIVILFQGYKSTRFHFICVIMHRNSSILYLAVVYI